MPSCIVLLALSLHAAGAPATLLQKFIETGNKTYLTEARTNLEQAPVPEQNKNQIRYLRARLEYLSGNYEKALTLAKELNRVIPDELDPYALIVDASRALGRLEEAEAAAQWMLNLRPDDARGLQRAVGVREDLKDLTGAEEFLVESYKRVAPSDSPARASVITQMAGVKIRQQHPDEARKLIHEAFRLIPDYYPAAELLRRLEDK